MKSATAPFALAVALLAAPAFAGTLTAGPLPTGTGDRVNCRILNASPRNAKDVVVETVTVSNAYNMARCRIGHVVVNRDMNDALGKIKGYYDYWIFQAIQIASIIAMRHCDDEIVKQAKGDSDRFLKEAAQLADGRDLTIRRLILETMEEVLPRLNKIILDGRGGGPIDLGLFEEKP